MRIKRENLPLIHRYAAHGRIVVFDTETTGMTNDDEICQIAAVEYKHGRECRNMAEYLTPACPMNPYAEQAHGLSLDFLRQNGVPPAIGLDRFLAFLGGDVLLVAHNLRFDMRMLNNACVQYGIEHDGAAVETCDTLALARFAMPELDCYTLANLVETLGVEGINSHNALDDAYACAGVFFKLIESLMKGEVIAKPLFRTSDEASRQTCRHPPTDFGDQGIKHWHCTIFADFPQGCF